MNNTTYFLRSFFFLLSPLNFQIRHASFAITSLSFSLSSKILLVPKVLRTIRYLRQESRKRPKDTFCFSTVLLTSLATRRYRMFLRFCFAHTSKYSFLFSFYAFEYRTIKFSCPFKTLSKYRFLTSIVFSFQSKNAIVRFLIAINRSFFNFSYTFTTHASGAQARNATYRLYAFFSS